MLVDSALYRDRESLNIQERFVGFKAYQGNLFASTADKRIFQVTSAAVDEVRFNLTVDKMRASIRLHVL